jgi:hypothetical protein
MWKSTVEPSRPQMIIWRTRIACRIPTATNTHSEYVIQIAFPFQKWLNEHASMLHYWYADCLLVTRHVQVKPVRKFSWSNYRKALKSVPLSAVAVRTISWWANAMRASVRMGSILKILGSFSQNTPQTRFIWRNPTWGSHTLKMNWKKSNHYISSRLGVKTGWYRNVLLNFQLQPIKNSSLCCNEM